MHILLYGGTFDPIHNGHLITSRAAREALGADLLLFMPAWVSPHKVDRPCASPEARAEMIRLAIGGETGMGLDTWELERGGAGGPGGASYTVDTLEHLRGQRPGARITLLLGQDQLAKFHAWHRVAEILRMAEVALMGRPEGRLEAQLAQVAASLGSAAAERIRAGLLATPLIEISATEVRERVRRGLSIRGLAPEAVAGYIAREGLYRTGEGV